MTRARKDGPPWHGRWLALVPYRFHETETATTKELAALFAMRDDPTFAEATRQYQPTCGRPVLLTADDTKEEQLAFYKALLEVPWLSPKVRRAVKDVLGMPGAQEEKAGLHEARAWAHRWNIKQEAARMKASGEKPREGGHRAATQHEADRVGMKREALEKYMSRYAPTTKRRRT